MNAAALDPVSSRASAKAAIPLSGIARRNTTLCASTGLPLSQITGDAIGYVSRRCSVNAVTPVSGANEGKFHQASVNGTSVAFHARMAVFSSGSPRSE